MLKNLTKSKSRGNFLTVIKNTYLKKQNITSANIKYEEKKLETFP